MAPYNVLAYLFSAVPNQPYLDVRQLPDLAPLRDNWRTIREEALNLYDQDRIKRSEKYHDLAFNSFFRSGWKRFYLKWYGAHHASAQELCPKTVELLEKIPTVKAAMFAMLPPGAKLGRHRDPFAGSLRYHLGLVTPNSDDCRIYVDGQMYSWRDGEAVLFDETFIHWAENATQTARIILFCDVERPLHTGAARAANRFFGRTFVAAAATANEPGEKVGVLNRIFGFFHRMDPVLTNAPEADSGIYDADVTKKRFWRDTPVERRETLMPFFWKTLVPAGVVFGNTAKGSKVTVRNDQWFSYPGYSEILTGQPQPDVVSNDIVRYPHVGV